MLHRDSLGRKQTYGAQKRHGGNVAQWLVAGAGMLHEEMWDINHDEDGIVSKQELFQLWVNLPSDYKMAIPRVSLLNTSASNDGAGGNDTTGASTEDANGEDESLHAPIIETENVKTIVLVGEYANVRSNLETYSPMSILHVQMQPNSSWSMEIPDAYKTGILYMRTGSATMPSENDNAADAKMKQEIATHYTATLTPYGGTLQLDAGEDGADFMLLVGAPLYEPVEARGSMVMNSMQEIDVAYDDYQRGKMGLPWNQELTDEEWKEHVRRAPSIYHR